MHARASSSNTFSSPKSVYGLSSLPMHSELRVLVAILFSASRACVVRLSLPYSNPILTSSFIPAYMMLELVRPFDAARCRAGFACCSDHGAAPRLIPVRAIGPQRCRSCCSACRVCHIARLSQPSLGSGGGGVARGAVSTSACWLIIEHDLQA